MKVSPTTPCASAPIEHFSPSNNHEFARSRSLIQVGASVLGASLLQAVAAYGADTSPRAAAGSDGGLGMEVATLFRNNCAACHTPESNSFAGVKYRGDLNFILDLERLRTTEFLDLEEPEQSELYLYITEGEMPPEGAVDAGLSRVLNPVETATVLAWIRAGAPAAETTSMEAAEAEVGSMQFDRGREAFQESCTSCHGASRALGKNKSEARWRVTVERMADKSGARVNRSEIDAIVAYLAAQGSQDLQGGGLAPSADGGSFLDSLLFNGTFSLLYRDSGRDDRMENQGFTVEAWLSAEWHSEDSAFSARVSACTTCHVSSEPEGRPFEILEAAFRFDIKKDPGATEGFVDGGRILVPFGAFSAQSNPAAYRTVARPLIYNMGQGVDRNITGPSVLPLPYADEGFLVHLNTPVAGDVTAELDTYVINGLQGTLDVDFYQSREFSDNNGDPALGGRLTIGTPSLALGVSGMTGNMEGSAGGIVGRLGYELFGLDLSARLGSRLRVQAEVARRKNDQVTFMPSIPRGRSNVEGYVIGADFLLLEDAGVSLVARLDSLRHEATVPPLGSPLSNNYRTDRFTWGFDIGAWGGSSVMINHEHWSMPAGLDSVDVVGLRWVVSF